MMKKSLIILCILIILLSSCTPKEEYFYIEKGFYKSSVYSSGFATEGNDYYYINVSESEPEPDDEYRHLYESISIPSRYILDIDADYQTLWYGEIENAKEDGVNAKIPTPNIYKFIVNIYEIGSEKLVRSIDIKPFLDNLSEELCIVESPYGVLAIKGQPYFVITMCDTVHSTKEEKNITYKWFCVNLLTGKYLMSEISPTDFRIRRSAETTIFSTRSEFYNLNSDIITGSKRFMSIENLTYWEGCKDIAFFLDELPNNEKLYSKFPSLKSEVEELKSKGKIKNSRVHIILTGDPSYDELASYVVDEGKEATFDGMTILENESVDGKEHTVHSADEWFKYRNLPEADMSWLSPIFPREE